MISCIIESRVPFLISLFNFQGPIAYPLSRTAQRVYHTLFSLSILFWKFFEIFFNLFCFRFFLTFFALWVSLSLRACIYYHLASFLSTLFTNFFVHFSLYIHLSILASGCFCVQLHIRHHILCLTPLFLSFLYLGYIEKEIDCILL